MEFKFLKTVGLQSLRMLFVLLIGLQFACNAQEDLVVSSLLLDGEWDIIYDDENLGIKNNWFQDAVFEKQSFKKIDVPSCWEEYEKNYEGVGIYRTKFQIPDNWNDRVVELNFGAVNYKSEFWLNDQVVGFHEGGYTPFSFRVDKLIKPGEENTLVVRVISPIILTDKYIDGMGRQEVPMWRGAITGGIWQSVSIESKGSLGLSDVFIEPDINTNTAIFNVEIENTETATEASELQVEIYSKDNKKVASQTKAVEILPGKNTLRWNLKIEGAHYWSPDDPYLYKAKVSIKKKDRVSDKWDSRFGMREFTVKDDKFYLNGEPIYLKAAFFEGLYPAKLAYPDTREMAIKEIKLAKEAGFNMIRPWRKPAPPMWLDLCDEMGVLTVGSLVVECMKRPISTPRLPFVVENELRKTILTNRNRTCIVQWELFNEINRPILAQMLNSMSVLARELDPTRMILDESGGWGEGANIYLPNQRTPKKFNDIHHYSGSQVDETEFDGYLATAKSKSELKELGLTHAKGYGRNVVPSIMSYISELGYGSTPNLTLNNKDFSEKGNPIVAPTLYHKELDEGYRRVLEETGFDKIYPRVEDFYLEQQKMHGIANKRMLEATRLNTTVAGYCVHALVGGDWVLGAGLLDLWRNPKTLVYDMTKEANQKQIAPIRILPRNVYAEKGARLEVHGVSELPDEPVTVDIKIQGKNKETVFSKTLETQLKNGISNLLTTHLNTADLRGPHKVSVTIRNAAGETIVSNSQYFDVFKSSETVVAKRKIALVDPDGNLSKFFEGKGIQTLPFDEDLDKNILVIVGNTNKGNPVHKKQVAAVTEFVKSGGFAVMLKVMGKPAVGLKRKLKEVQKEAIPFEVQLLPKWHTRGGWAAKSHVVTKHPIFKDLPTEQIMHGVYENVHPELSMVKQKGNNIAGMIGYDHFPNMDIMIRHYNGTGDVWWASDVLETDLGKGTIILSTLKILENLDKDPVADKILLNLIDYSTHQ